MLDDLKYIHTKDAQDALGAAQKLLNEPTLNITNLDNLQPSIDNVVIAGIGGSAAAAKLLNWANTSLPIDIHSSYSAPSYVSNKTLYIAISHSGNTEETLSAIDACRAKDAQIAVIASGGAMLEQAQTQNYPYIQLPATPQPRFATYTVLHALIDVLQAAKIIPNDTSTTLQTSAERVAGHSAEWTADTPTKKNYAKQLALELAGTTPIIHAGPNMYPAAHIWKIALNENAKNVTFSSQLPEFSHNEFIGWTSHPVDKPFSIVDLRSTTEHERILKRFTVSERLLSGQRPHPYIVTAQGNTQLEHLLYCMQLGVFVSVYVALLNGQNPTPVDKVNDMKQALDTDD